MKKPRKATEKDLEKCLRLMEKWGKGRLDGVGWGVAGQLCACKKYKGCYAHMETESRAHIAMVYLHQVDSIERTALHEQLHLEMNEMRHVVAEMAWSAETKRQRQQAFKWYQYYEDDVICQITDTLLGMDKEIRKWKRRAKKLEKQID